MCAREAHIGVGFSVPASVPKLEPRTINRQPANKEPTKNGPEIVNFKPVLESQATLANRRLQPLGRLTANAKCNGKQHFAGRNFASQPLARATVVRTVASAEKVLTADRPFLSPAYCWRVAPPFERNRRTRSGPGSGGSPDSSPLNASQRTCGCQFTNVPLGFSFHAHTCSV
jgi:hypothetical protein